VSAVEKLCPQCSLCCNGVLFGDVELQRGDDRQKLGVLGMKLFKKGRKLAFSQPCSCLDGKLCTIYADRPSRCRSFECGQIRRVEEGTLTLAMGERNVREALRRADEVMLLLRRLGNHDESVPLNQRYAAVMVQPMDLGGSEEDVELRGELMMAVAHLVSALERNFLVGAK